MIELGTDAARTEATVREGYRVASGTSRVDPTFNADGGTIRLQIPEFRKRGLDLEAYFGGPPDRGFVCGTLGLSVAPRAVTIAAPEYRFDAVRWTDRFDRPGRPPFTENFLLSPASVEFRALRYKAMLYLPDPATKPAHHQSVSTIEVIAQPVPDIGYGARVILHYNPRAIELR